MVDCSATTAEDDYTQQRNCGLIYLLLLHFCPLYNHFVVDFTEDLLFWMTLLIALLFLLLLNNLVICRFIHLCVQSPTIQRFNISF
jgi:hypothetical protein